MRTLLLLSVLLSLGAVDIDGLPEGLAIDPKGLLGGEEYAAFDVGFITRKIQDFGYLDARVEFTGGRMIASPGKRYTITRFVMSNDEISFLFDCDMPMTQKNREMFEKLFPDFAVDRYMDPDDHSVQLVFRQPPASADAAP
jgi:hypothetical protein